MFCEIENKLKTIISGSLQEYFGTSWLVKGLPKNTYTKAKKLADEKAYEIDTIINSLFFINLPVPDVKQNP